MAEIHVERKSSRVWGWALLGLAALFLATCVVAWWRSDPRDPLTSGVSGGAAAGAAAGTTGNSSGAVGDYLTFVEEHRARQAAGPTHEYTADGLRRLAAAIAQLSERNGGSAEPLEAELNVLRSQADSLQRNPQSTDHARYAREAFRTAASLMSALQQRAYPKEQHPNVAAEVAQVRVVADLVLPARPLLAQTPDVQRFFDQSGAAIRAMASAGA
jgi:hypothetical protein